MSSIVIVSLTLVTMALSVVMLFVLSSVTSSENIGTREWKQANLLAVFALLCFAGRGALPDILSIELANLLFMGAISMMLVGFRRFAAQPVSVGILASGMAMVMAVIVAFHYYWDLSAVRVMATSIFHGAACLAIGLTVWKNRDLSQPRYPFLFTASAAFALTVAHTFRTLFYFLQNDMSVPLFTPTTWNVIFFSLGTLAFPGLTLGAVIMTNARMLARTAYAADHDHLTGAWSRRAFFNIAEREHARSIRAGTKLSLLVFDVDHFKRINDTFGHATGDRVLVEMVYIAGKTIRTVDLCARMGGEEFAVLLPDADNGTACAVAERLRAALEQPAGADTRYAELSYTVSIGIATMHAGESIEQLLARADEALYSAKQAGRNKVHSATAIS